MIAVLTLVLIFLSFISTLFCLEGISRMILLILIFTGLVGFAIYSVNIIENRITRNE